MALIYCPECGHEISNAAVACPHCGRPISAEPPVVERKVVVPQNPPVRDGLPAWAMATIGLLGVLLLFILFMFWSRSGEDEGNQRVKVNMDSGRPSTVSRPSTESAPSSVGTATAPPTETTVPGSQTSVTTAPTKGTVTIEAKVVTRNNAQQPVRNEKFYLLDKDPENILYEAKIEPIEGQSLTNSLGLAVMFPDRYADFRRDALRAINAHIKYSGTTDSAGKTQLGGVQPDSYYLFGMTKTGKGFAVWNSPVTVQAGENVLQLTPQPITEMSNTSG